MNEQQVRDRVSATADTIDCSPVPLAAIKRTGRTIVRRRTRARVVGAAAIVGAVGLAVAVPITVSRNNKPAPATEAPSSGLGDCPPGVSQSDGGDCDAIPGVREEQYEPTRRRALNCRTRTAASL